MIHKCIICDTQISLIFVAKPLPLQTIQFKLKENEENIIVISINGNFFKC